ncbi:MAG: mechanosensitive ion channel family protein [Pleurocapsa sp.]
MLRKGLVVLVLTLAFYLPVTASVRAQLPFLPQINWETFNFNQNPDNAVVSACVRLDGRCIFRLLGRRSNLTQRVRYTEERLKEISQTYFAQQQDQLEVYSENQGSQENIYVAIGDRQFPMITLNSNDADTRGVNLEHQAEQIANQLESGLKRARQERSQPHMIRQAQLAGITVLTILFGQLVISDGLKRSRQVKAQLETNQLPFLRSLADYVNHKQKFNLRSIQYRLLQVIQLAWWLGGILLILGLFPQTRSLQIWLITVIRIPLRIFLVSLLTYILIRLSNILIAKLNNTLAANYVLSRDTRRRMQVRVTTITRLVGGIIAILWIILGILAALALIGINVTPLLAGAGILGLALSFASQNFIKDALNGFFIILEDQYAVGDVIQVGEFAGLVENLNLRITQLRDGQGRLITIPNSEVKTVANLSSQWSRAEIDIPVAYQAEIDRALELIGQVAQEMDRESDWQEQIIEPPEVLGVDNFSDRGSVVRIWIKTEPLRQWAVAREFRRRLQKAFEQHNIPLPTSQQKIWFDRSTMTNDQTKK